MRSKDKQNKHKLKFDYIHNLQLLGKIWKNHTDLVNPKISKDLNSYNEEVVKLMSKNNKDINRLCEPRVITHFIFHVWWNG